VTRDPDIRAAWSEDIHEHDHDQNKYNRCDKNNDFGALIPRIEFAFEKYPPNNQGVKKDDDF
jgi:hypothetical protein